MAAFPLAGVAADSDKSGFQLWPEFRVDVGIADQTEVQFLGERTRDQDTGRVSAVQAGLTVTHRFDDALSFGLGYRYGFVPNMDSSREQRLFAEQTVHFDLPWTLRLGLRTREELRWIDGDFSVRLRERARLERDVLLDTYRFTPYASAEIFWDSRYGAFNRSRFIVGATFPVAERFTIEPYLAHEFDWQPTKKNFNALGLILTLSF